MSDEAPAPIGNAAPRNGMGTAALVLGIIGLVLLCAYGVGIILAVIAIVLGVIGLRRVKKGVATNRGMALIGVVLGIVTLVVGAIIMTLLVIWGINTGPPPSLDPANNSTTGLADGEYRLQVKEYFLFSDECSYTGTPIDLATGMAAGPSVTVVGLSETTCAFTGLKTGAVYFEVSGGVATVLRVE